MVQDKKEKYKNYNKTTKNSTDDMSQIQLCESLMTELGELNNLRIKDSFLQLLSLSKARNPVPV